MLRIATYVAGVMAIGLALASQASADIYWANLGTTHSIGHAELDGGGVDQDLIEASFPCGVAANDTYVYWANPGTSSIGRAKLDGSSADASFIEGADEPCGVAIDDTHIFWGNSGSGSDSVGRADLDGSNVDHDFIPGGAAPSDVVVDDNYVYWTNIGAADGLESIGRADLDGSDPDQEFISGRTGLGALEVDDAHLYWTIGEAGNHSIARADLDGGNFEEDFITDVSTPSAVDVTGSRVYWTNFGTDSIGRADIDGSNEDGDFITGADNPLGIAVDSQTVPACQAASAEVAHAEAAQVQLECTGGDLTHAIASDPANGQLSGLDAAAGAVTYTGNPGFFGQDTFTFTASNPSGASPAATATIRVMPAANEFTLRRKKPTRRNRRRGNAKLLAEGVPGPGQLVLRGRGIRKVTADVEEAGTVGLKVRAKGRRKRALNHRGRVRVKARVTFSPFGGEPNTKLKRVKLVRRR
jgi:virginiamycin B lyase